MLKVDPTVREKGLEALAPTLSVTDALKANVPEVAGVPLIIPVIPRERPGGNIPEVTVQVYGGVPPWAARTPK
jgi:hypothetical protein